MTSPSSGGSQREQVIPVIEEALEVRRQVVDTGVVVQINKVVSEKLAPVAESLTSEFVSTERVKVGRVIDGPVAVRYEGDVMIVPVIEERLVVRKELFLAEELRVIRRRETREVHEDVLLRREQLTVRRFDPLTQQWQEESGVPLPDRASGPGPPV